MIRAKRGDHRGGTLCTCARHLQVFLAADGSGGTVPGSGIAAGGVGNLVQVVEWVGVEQVRQVNRYPWKRR